ncbi:unnamed protein product [Pylaiella littoralis]
MFTAGCNLPPVPSEEEEEEEDYPWSTIAAPSVLHEAAYHGSTEDILSILSRGSVAIDHVGPGGYTPLMFAARKCQSSAVRVLLNKGANLSIVGDDSFTALHISAHEGDLATTKMLVEAGADLEEAISTGATPLYLAASYGRWEVVRALIAAGANPGRCIPSGGSTPLHAAAEKGHVRAVRELLRANVNPSLIRDGDVVPLDLATRKGYSGVVRELIRQVGIEGCGGPSAGQTALRMAAVYKHMDIMVILMDAGVVDAGSALVYAAQCGDEGPVKFLLQRRKMQEQKVHKRERETMGEVSYVNSRDSLLGQTPLLASIMSFSPRIGRILIDAGADTTSAVQFTVGIGEGFFNETPLALISSLRRDTFVKEELRKIEATRRLLLQVDAVRAVSWLWPGNIPAIAPAAKVSVWTEATSSSLTVMMPTMRRSIKSRGVLSAALHR